MTTATLRPELTEMPPRLRHLPIDERGYPVPWFVQWVEKGTMDPVSPQTPGAVPEFRAMDQTKWVRAIREQRCWVCGDPLGVFKVFVVGPMCGINRTTAEPPSHLACAEWSVVNCPFLARPHMVRRDNDGLMEQMKEHVAGEMLERNPGVTLLWTTKSYTMWRDPHGKPLLTMGDPITVCFYTEGRRATRAEIDASVAGGFPALQAMAERQDREEGSGASREELARQRARFDALCPDI